MKGNQNVQSFFILLNQKYPPKNLLLLITEVIEMDSEYLRLPDFFVILSKIMIFLWTMFFQVYKCFCRKQSFHKFYFSIFSNSLFRVHIFWLGFSFLIFFFLYKVHFLFMSIRRMNSLFKFFLFLQSSFENTSTGTSYYRKLQFSTGRKKQCFFKNI